MNVREKLVALLKTVPTRNGYADLEEIADHLIAHGVTVQEWIPVTEKLPDKPMKCLVYDKRGDCGIYDIVYYGQGSYIHYSDTNYWMPLPEPPKGE